jgi:AcrR family transcriptional regulator
VRAGSPALKLGPVQSEQEATNRVAKTRGRGRPSKGADDTRALILDAGAKLFFREGYDATSMRAIARAARVDPALVRHYFASKADLFAEAIAAPVRPDRIVTHALQGPRERIGENLIRYVVQTLDTPGTSQRVVRIMHTALGQEFAATLFRQFVMREVLKQIASQLGEEDAELRASFAATQVVGLVLARYGIRIEPLASASPEEVVARVGPVVQWYLTGAEPPISGIANNHGEDVDRPTPTSE